VYRALDDLQLEPGEHRAGELRRLREQIERNLSGLMGPALARMIVNERLELDASGETALSYTFRVMEDRLEASRSQLRGLAGELDTLRRYHRQVLQDLPLGVCALSAEREVVIWNLAMELISGVARRDALDRKVTSLPGPWGTLLVGFASAEDHHTYRQQMEVNGYPRWFNFHKASIDSPLIASANQRDERPGLVILLEDLTDLETLEAELAHSERLASIGRLAAGVAHEIGNPVTGIACLAQNLRAEEYSDLVRTSVDQILQQTKRIGNIVDSLMSFSRSGTPQENRERMNLHDTVLEAIRLVRLSRSGREVECLNACPTDLELQGDRQKFIQVFVNLLTNACDASQPGERVEVSGTRENGQVQIEVRDKGEGIPRELRDRVFEPFFTTKRPGEGTGLGLPMVYRIIGDYGGSVELDSNGGTGTRAIVRLPLSEPEPLSMAP
jgi:signal transduction histidine kinase